MLSCMQKFCKHCVKPYFNINGKFLFGQCKKSRNLILYSSNAEETKEYSSRQPLYCAEYEKRKRPIKY